MPMKTNGLKKSVWNIEQSDLDKIISYLSIGANVLFGVISLNGQFIITLNGMKWSSAIINYANYLYGDKV